MFAGWVILLLIPIFIIAIVYSIISIVALSAFAIVFQSASWVKR